MRIAKIYIRRNGQFGASCDDCQDTGRHITGDSGKFTVYHILSWGEDDPIVAGVTREQAEEAIARDRRSSP